MFVFMLQHYQTRLNKIVDRALSKNHILGAVFHVSDPARGLSLISSGGNLQRHSPYYIASINKTMLAALALRRCRDHELKLTDRVTDFLPAGMLDNTLVWQGRDRSGEITVGQLISQTSGLPCYLTDRQADGSTMMKQLLSGKDRLLDLEEVLESVRQMKTLFPPGAPGKARYSNTNVRLLSRVLEQAGGKNIKLQLQGLFQELNMHQTHIMGQDAERTYLPVYVQEKTIYLNQYLGGTGYEVISSAADQMRFLQAWFDGYFYPREALLQQDQWNKVFFPFSYGIGMQRFSIPRLLSPFKPVPPMIGHSGSVGSVAFYVPQRGLYITGTVNQTRATQLAFQSMLQIVQKFS